MENHGKSRVLGNYLYLYGCIANYMNVNLNSEVERDFKCAVIQKYGSLRGHLERDVHVALCLLMRCEEEGIALDTIKEVTEYLDQH